VQAKLATAPGVWLPCRVPNLYLLMKTDGPADEISADFYQREDDDWVFMLGGAEVARMPIDSIVSIAKAPRDMTS
jgi:hypothetical protein